MLDPHLGLVMLASFALVIGGVIFGGTTLTYFLDKRRPSTPLRPRAASARAAKTTVSRDNREPPRDQAA